MVEKMENVPPSTRLGTRIGFIEINSQVNLQLVTLHQPIHQLLLCHFE